MTGYMKAGSIPAKSMQKCGDYVFHQSDKIIVLDKGNIVEEGTHEQLIQNEGIYSGFYNQQSTKAEPIFLV